MNSVIKGPIRKNNSKWFLATVFSLIVLIGKTNASQYFVSPTGSNTNPGTSDQPFLSISKAMSLSSSVFKQGDTLWVRDGVYIETANISISKSGTSSLIYNLWAWPGERAMLDFSSLAFGTAGISLKGSYWYIRGLDIKGAGDNGMNVSGSNNIIENCSFFENRDSGLQLSSGAANNKIINCDSYYNADPPDFGDADGFACKMDVGSGNYFYGCRSWMNVDDGWDGYLRGTDNVSTTINNCWTFKNGYLKNGNDGGSNANGQGFKMGGSDLKNLKHDFKLTNCLSFMNKANGFDQNSNMGSMILYSCTAYANKGNNYYISKPLASGKIAEIKNSIELGGKVSLVSYVQQGINSWKITPVAAANDFISIDTSLFGMATSKRKSDGSLPDITFMHLSQGNRFIDAGENVGLLFNGSAPDLGCFETGVTLDVKGEKPVSPKHHGLKQNFPNPFNPSTQITFVLTEEGPVTIKIFKINGSEIETLVDEVRKAGTYSINWNGENNSSGIYICRLTSQSGISNIKMSLLK